MKTEDEHGELENRNAFPLTDGSTFCTDGLTHLDYVAAQIASGLCTDPNWYDVNQLAQHAYKIAAAILRERVNYIKNEPIINDIPLF